MSKSTSKPSARASGKANPAKNGPARSGSAAKPAPNAPKGVAKSLPGKPAPKPSAKVASSPAPAKGSAAKGPAAPGKVTAKPASQVPVAAKPTPPKPVSAKPAIAKPAVPAPAVPKPAGAKSSLRSGTGGRSSRKPLEPANTRSVAAAAAASAKTDANGYVIINGRRVRMISTKDIQVAKRSRSAEAKPAADAAAVDVSNIKTKLTKKELEPYRQLLLQRRAEILGLVNGMEQEALRSSGGNLSHMPIHMADIGTDTADQDFALNLAEKERETINEIDAALQRIEDGTFGICQATGRPIPKARLDAKPWAKYTIEAARLVESGHKFAS